MSIRKCLIVGAAFLGLCFFSQKAETKSIDYNGYAQVLETYVDDQGRVNYAGLKANRIQLDKFVKQIEEADLASMSKVEQKAFWINAYNARTLQLIIDHYPLRFGGIRTINWGRPWNISMKFAQQELTLGDVEHEILRKWDPPDPRIHFAINCASGGCPQLPNRIFESTDLDDQLAFETKRFIQNPEKVRLDRAEKKLYISAIFDWFEEDFLLNASTLTDYIKEYMRPEDKKFLENNNVKVKVLSYDWGLNEQ